MLRSLTSRLLGRAHSAGLMIGRTQLSFSSTLHKGTGPCITRSDTRVLARPLFVGPPTNVIQDELAVMLRELMPEAVNQYLPLHVSLPGAAVQIAAFALDVLPKTQAERLDLTRWHFMLAAVAGQTLACDCESIGRDGDKQLILGYAMDAAWHACIVGALAQAGMTAWSLNADICRQFNQFHERLIEEDQGGALVAVDPDSWSLLVWDDAGRVRYCSSRWRRSGENEFTAIAEEIERRILTCVASLPALKVEHVFIATGDGGAALADAMDARLREPCIRLLQDVPVERDDTNIVMGSFASVSAAVQG